VHIEKAFAVALPRDSVIRQLDSDATLQALFPDTRVTSRQGGVRETCTRVSLPGVSREVRFVFETRPDGNVRFRKICDGHVWRALDGEIRLEALDAARTRVVVSMQGRTRALIPELAISGQLRSQLDKMVESLRDRMAAIQEV
jgi:hypothetical protein